MISFELKHVHYYLSRLSRATFPRHSTDVEQLKRLLVAVLGAGFNLVAEIDVAVVIEDATKQRNVASALDELTLRSRLVRVWLQLLRNSRSKFCVQYSHELQLSHSLEEGLTLLGLSTYL